MRQLEGQQKILDIKKNSKERGSMKKLEQNVASTYL